MKKIEISVDLAWRIRNLLKSAASDRILGAADAYKELGNEMIKQLANKNKKEES